MSSCGHTRDAPALGKLREAADAVGSRYDDKWWRDGQDWTARWASEVVGKAATGRTRA